MSSLQLNLEHFCTKALACAFHLQSASPTAESLSDPCTMSVHTADQFTEKFFQCIEGLPAPQVEWLREFTCMLRTLQCYFASYIIYNTNITLSRMPAYTVVLEKVSGLSLHAKARIQNFVADKLGEHNYLRTLYIHVIFGQQIYFLFVFPIPIFTIKGNKIYCDSHQGFL